jgi:hypothetical protein
MFQATGADIELIVGEHPGDRLAYLDRKSIEARRYGIEEIMIMRLLHENECAGVYSCARNAFAASRNGIELAIMKLLAEQATEHHLGDMMA